jgi:hypothetical protein
MNNVIALDLGHTAPESECGVLIECVREAIQAFGEHEFALSLVEQEQEERKAA